MTGFLYYVPGRNTLDRREVDELGLGYAYAGREIKSRQCTAGPDNKSGIVVALGPDSDKVDVGYYPHRNQRWRKIPNSAVWVGFSPSDPPTPAILARRQMLDGHPLELNDGQAWTVPLARQLVDDGDKLKYRVALPQSVDVDSDTGEWRPGGVLPRYADLWNLAAEYFDLRYGEDGPRRESLIERWTYDHQLSQATAVLQVNYHVGAAELGMLGLLTVELARSVLDLLVDVPTLDEFIAKKKAQTEPEPAT